MRDVPARSDDVDEDEPLGPTANGVLLHLADTADVVLVVENAWLQGGRLLCPQGMAEVSVRDCDDAVAVDDPERVLRLTAEPFLPEATVELRVRLHVHARLRPVHAGVEGAGALHDPAVPVQLGGVLPEVPDVAARVLGVVVAGPVREAAAQQ